MHARILLFSSHIQAHDWVLVYKPNKDSCLFSMWDNTFFEKLLFTNTSHIENIFHAKIVGVHILVDLGKFSLPI